MRSGVRALVWVLAAALALGRPVAFAQTPFNDGLAAGNAANASARGTVNPANAAAVVPGYTSTPPEAALAGRPALGAEAQSRLAACATTPGDVNCQALRNAVNSANAPRPGLSLGDAGVAGADRIARNPALGLGNLASYYSGCTTGTTTTPARTEVRSCLRYEAGSPVGCSNRLNVAVERGSTCEPGSFFSSAAAGPYRVEAQCLPDRDNGQQHFRLTESGRFVAEFDLSTGNASPMPALVGNAGDVIGRLFFKGVYAASNGCLGGTCQVSVFVAPLVYGECSRFPNAFGCGERYPFRRNASNTGWETNPNYPSQLQRMDLVYQQPSTAHEEFDTWANSCPTNQTAGRCKVVSAPICVDGPSTKTIDGVAVTRSCWEYKSAMDCGGGGIQDQCSALTSQSCKKIGAECQSRNASTGICEVYKDNYSCDLPAQTATTASNCPSDVFCLGGNCFNISAVADADFARAMTYMEAARHGGVYLDPARMEVFQGEAGSCRNRLFTNCCKKDSSGKGLTNQSAFGVGTKLVYDVLMKAENREFVYYGLKALLGSAGFSGSFTSYGITIAVNGTAIPAGSTVLYSSSAAAGQGVVIAFDPWSLALAVVVFVVLSMMSCNEEEGRMALQEGAGLCHEIGTYCSSCIRVLGKCVSCIERTTGKCCFNSLLARLINEQGRAQIGKGWGSAQSPECSGFTVEQLQALNFGAMDFSEFYASISPTMPDINALRSQNAGKVTSCYYGAGKCATP